MFSTYRPVSTLVLLLVLLLAACGGAPSEPTAVPEPTAVATEEPTATEEPAPTEEPTATEEPAPTEEPEATPSGELAAVEIGDLETYTHDTGLFTIDVPSNWTLQDTSKEDEIIIIWTDPTNNALIGVDIFENAEQVSQEQLTDFLQNFLENTFGSNENFTTDPPVEQSDGSVLIVWGYTAEASNGVSAPLTGNSFIEQRGNKISILTTLVPEAQFETLLDQTNTIINTYRIDESVAIGDEAPAGSGELLEVQVGDLEPYAHPSGVFSIDLPTDWELTDSSTADEIIQIWTDPTGNAFISVNIFEDENEATSDDLAAFLDNYLRETFSDQENFLIEEATPQSDDSVLIVWGYEASTPVGNVRANMTGNSFIEQRGNKVSILTVLVPQAQFDSLLDRTNAIINTYQINPDASLGG